MSGKRDPFPLQWPDGWKRAVNRFGRGTREGYAKFDGQFVRDRDAVLRQLRKRGGNIVITSNLPLRQDGLPYAASNVRDPGIAVYWVERGKERVMACDRWNTVSLNMRAIDMSLEALRGLDRWGAAEMVDRAFAGFAALPPGPSGTIPPAPTKRPWREVLYPAWPSGSGWPSELDNAELLVLAKSRFKKLITVAHPDNGGDQAAAAELNVAIADAELELTTTKETT